MMTQTVKSRYDELAEEFSLKGLAISSRLHKKTISLLKDHYGFNDKSKILDIAPSMNSHLTKSMKKRTSVMVYNQATLSDDYNDIRLCESGGKIPYEDRSFDLILVNGLRKNIDQLINLVEYKRVLKKGGSLVIYCSFPDPTEDYFALADYLFGKMLGSDKIAVRGISHLPKLEKAGFKDYQRLTESAIYSWDIETYLGQISSIPSYRRALKQYHPIFMGEFEKSLRLLVRKECFQEKNLEFAFIARKA